MVGLAVAIAGLQELRPARRSAGEQSRGMLAADAPPALRFRQLFAASEKLLTKLDVWREIVAQRGLCYHGMEV